MTAITFPNSPSAGDTHTAGNGIVYTYDGEKWTSIGTNSAGTWTRSGTEVSLTNAGDDLNVDSGSLFVDASTDRVGVGTTSPQTIAHIYNENPVFRIQDSSTAIADAFAGIQLAESVSGGGLGNYWQIALEGDSGTSSDHLTFKDGTGERMRIDSSGNVGIGTTNPLRSLHIVGAGDTGLMLQTTNAVDDNELWEVQVAGNANNQADLIFRTRSNAGTGGSEKLRITRPGNVGINNSSPSSQLDIKTAAVDTDVFAIGRQDHSSIKLFRIFQDSNVSQGSGACHINTSNRDLILTASTNGAIDEGIYLKGTGQVLLGTSSDVVDSTHCKLQIASSGGASLALGRDDAAVTAGNDIGLIRFYGNDGGTYQECARIGTQADLSHAANDKPGRLVFSTTADGASSPTERMRITSSGRVLIGATTTPNGGSNGGSGFINESFDRRTLFLATTANSAGLVRFHNTNGQVGTITVNGSGTSFNESSDYRLKENVVDISDGISRLKQLRPRRFNFIVDAETTVDGFIAHEAQTVVPQSVTGTKDEVDDDGNPVMQGIDKSKLVPLLTAALQEAIAKIETLEQRLSDAGIA